MMDLIFMSGVWKPSIEMDSPFNGYTGWLRKNYSQFYQELKKKKRKLKNFPQEVHFTHWAAQRTRQYIQNLGGEKPFFCVMSVFDPHNPYDDYPKRKCWMYWIKRKCRIRFIVKMK